MNGYSGHTFMWYNRRGECFWVKIHLETEQEIQNFNREEARRTCGQDPDHATRDLYRAIENGDFPAWKVYVQIMTPEEVEKYRFNSFDVTKVWLHGDAPLRPVGRMVLNRNPENYFAEVEQAAFSPGNLVPGIAPSPDKMLQGRIFSYPDTHRHRLGPNYHLLPVNSAKGIKVDNYQRDGSMRCDNNAAGAPNYYPNSFGGPTPQPEATQPALKVSGKTGRHRYSHPNDDFVQPGELYRRVMSEQDRTHLIGNIVDHLGGAKKRIQLRQTALFYKVDPDYGSRVAQGLGLNIEEIKGLAGMTQEERVKKTSQ